MPRRKLSFDQLIEALNTQEQQGILLDNCMSLDAQTIRQIPLRYRIIALGFVRGMKLDELQQKLLDNGCPKLYARSPLEATLIFAFSHGIGYKEWKRMYTECGAMIPSARQKWFSDARITYAELESYVTATSQADGSKLETSMYTERLLADLISRDADVSALQAILRANAEVFSPVREKTRYYFCKYLYYYLAQKQEDYFDALHRGRNHDDALTNLLPFKVITKLRRNKTMPEEEKRSLLHSSPISCGELFDSLNLHFFGYVSLDWINVLLETYTCLEDIPRGALTRLAETARRTFPELMSVRDDREAVRQFVLLTEKRADNDSAQSRTGELAVYSYMKGTTDISRSVLLCFLLFFSGSKGIPEADRISTDRLQEILTNCGYTPLQPEESDFDWFVAEYLESDDPMELLSDLVTESAVRFQQNSFLYRVYCGGTSLSGEFSELIGDN